MIYPPVMEKPEGEHCYIKRVFASSTVCPELKDDVSLHPRCKKYSILLTWTRSGNLIKCQQCIDGDKEETIPQTFLDKVKGRRIVDVVFASRHSRTDEGGVSIECGDYDSDGCETELLLDDGSSVCVWASEWGGMTWFGK